MSAMTETEVVQGIGSDYEVKYGFHVPEDYFFKSRPRALARARRRDLEPQERARLDAEVPAQEPGVLPRAAAADLGRRPRRGIDFENIFYYIRPTEKQAKSLGGPARRHQGHLGQARDPGGGEEVPRRRRRPVRVRGRLPQAPGRPRGEGRDLPRHGLGPARARGARQAVLRHDHPAERQQVRGAELGGLVGRLVHLRAAGRPRRDAAAGLLPDQRREHGPVRAHADHRRRGRVRALRRGLHGADLLVRLAALGGGRDHRQAARALPLHDDPELVEQRLQPRHQARRRLRGRDDGVGRREPRLEADDEVPGDLADGRARPRRGALDRVRRHGPAPGRGRQVRPRRAAHDVGDHLEVDLEERRPRRLPRAAQGGEGRRRARSRRSSATR